MESGDFIYIDYVARIKDTGQIFDLTIEDVAKREGIFNAEIKYRPVPVIVGAGFTLPGLEEALKGMAAGEKKTVEIPPEKAFGERKAELIRLVPISKFKEQNIGPVPGMPVELGVEGSRLRGRITSIAGGRVMVDFNHPLAGKELEYEIEIKNQIKDVDEKIKATVSSFTGIEKDEIETVINEKEAEIKIKKRADVPKPTKEIIANTAIKWIKEIERVKFVDVYENNKEHQEVV